LGCKFLLHFKEEAFMFFRPRFVFHFFCTLLVTLVLLPAAFAQTPTGTVVGTITDPAGAAIPGATVTIQDVAPGATRTTTTSHTGAYQFATLLPSAYQVSVEAAGFRRAVQRDINLAVGDVVRADIKLNLGSATETVEVKADNPLIEPDKT